MSDMRLGAVESRFAEIIWNNAPLPSGELVKRAEAELGWKKSTTYTVLKKLCDRGFAENRESIVTALVPQAQVQAFESQRVVDRTFAGSLPKFLVSFLEERKLTQEEAQELLALIESHKEG